MDILKYFKGTPKNPKTKKEEINVPINHKNFRKAWFWLKFIVILMVLGFSIWGVIDFFNQYSLRIPFQSPIVPKYRKAIISPVGKGKPQSMIFDVGAIAEKIYILESSGGRNDPCRSLGLYNGYGFEQNNFEWKCFASHEQVRQLVIDWLETHIKNGDIESALCLYNRGISERGCSYSINYK